MLEKSFTVDQANALIPWLVDIFEETRMHAAELLELRANKGDDEDRMLRIRELEKKIQMRVKEATSMGIEVRRIDGLVDFPTVVDGEVGFLCWSYGEDQITHWHPFSEGYGGRRPLDPFEAELCFGTATTTSSSEAALSPL